MVVFGCNLCVCVESRKQAAAAVRSVKRLETESEDEDRFGDTEGMTDQQKAKLYKLRYQHKRVSTTSTNISTARALCCGCVCVATKHVIQSLTAEQQAVAEACDERWMWVVGIV